MGLGAFLVKEELSRPGVDGPSPAKGLRQNYSLLDRCPAVAMETDLLGCSSPRGCSAEPVGAAGALLEPAI